MTPTTNGKTAYATIRELAAVEKSLLAAMHEMETRLTAAIVTEHEHHDGIHAGMMASAETRHRRIDDFIAAERTAAAVDSGRSNAYRQIIGALRTFNEFRWLLAMLAAAALWATGTVHIGVSI